MYAELLVMLTTAATGVLLGMLAQRKRLFAQKLAHQTVLVIGLAFADVLAGLLVLLLVAPLIAEFPAGSAANCVANYCV